MDFFDKLSKTASKTYKGAAEKTGKIAKEAKLKMKISENKSKIEDIYEEIGKKVYQKHVDNSEEFDIQKFLDEQCAKIDELSNEIEKANKEILDLANVKICVNEKCKETIAKEAKFCPKCGAEQPVEQSAKKEAEQPDKQDAKKTEEQSSEQENEVIEAEVVENKTEERETKTNEDEVKKENSDNNNEENKNESN